MKRDSHMNKAGKVTRCIASVVAAVACVCSDTSRGAPTALNADMTNSAVEISAPLLNSWSPDRAGIAYLFAGNLDRQHDAGAAPWTVLTVGAQINAVNRSGVNQIAFGIATEAWAEHGSFSMLTGLEATTINLEPDNALRKISLWSTFKNRRDTDYYAAAGDPANMGSQALRIESQAGTGFERGIVFAAISLHPSRALARPVAIDFGEVPLGELKSSDVIRFPDGCALIYVGRGHLETRWDDQ